MKAVFASIFAGLLIYGCTPSPQLQSPAISMKTNSESSANSHDVVVQSLKKWLTVQSFRQRFTTTSDGTTTNGTMEFVAPDRVHLVMEIAGETFESITIGQTEYSKNADGKWLKTVTGADATRLFTDPKQIASLASDITDVQSVGTEVVEGVPSNVYQFKHKLGNSPTIYQSKLWIGVMDGLPRKFQTTYEQMISSGTYSDYNAGISINAPIQ